MTREEAIEWMQEEKARFERAPDLNGCPMTECWQKAIDVYDMAISALRQQEQERKASTGEGLRCKYIVRKADTGEGVDGCFVLRPDRDRAAVAALRAYAAATDNDALATDILNWVGHESNEPLTLDELRQMNGEPVWWWNKSAKPVCTICVWDRFMDEPMFANYDWQSEYTLQLSKYKWLKKCGYKPYRQKPEEGTV